MRSEWGQVTNKGQMELPLWGGRVGVGSGGAAGSAGRGHPWLIWGKPAICWAHGEPSSAEVPPPGKWSFKGWCLPASSFMGKLQGRGVQTDLILGLEETGCHSQRVRPRWPSAPHVHARPESRLLCTSAPWTRQRRLSAAPHALRGTQCVLSPQVGLVECGDLPGGCPAGQLALHFPARGLEAQGTVTFNYHQGNF